MPAQTFRDVWSSVLLHAPAVPTALAQKWCQDGYNKLIANRHWSWTRRQTTLSTRAARSGIVTFTQGQQTLTSAAGLFSPDIDGGRQIRVGNGYIYTLDTIDSPFSATLVEAYAEDSGDQSATISDIYLGVPLDFRSFETVLDMSNNRPICWWIAKDRLDLFDPGRLSADSRLRVLAAHQISQRQANFGQVLYEAWPHPTAAGTYVLNYFVHMDALSADTPFQGPLATFTDAIEIFALASAAKWPGTADQKNPYFNLQLAKQLDLDFKEAFKEIDVMDDDTYLMDLAQVDLSTYGLASLAASTNLLQRTDADTGDYFGGFR